MIIVGFGSYLLENILKDGKKVAEVDVDNVSNAAYIALQNKKMKNKTIVISDAKEYYI